MVDKRHHRNSFPEYAADVLFLENFKATDFNKPVTNFEIVSRLGVNGTAQANFVLPNREIITPHDLVDMYSWVYGNHQKFWTPQEDLVIKSGHPTIHQNQAELKYPYNMLHYNTHEHFPLSQGLDNLGHPLTTEGIAPLKHFKSENGSDVLLLYVTGWGGGGTGSTYRDDFCTHLAEKGLDCMLYELPQQGYRIPVFEGDISEGRSGAYYIGINILTTMYNFWQLNAEIRGIIRQAKENPDLGYSRVVVYGSSGGGLPIPNTLLSGELDGLITYKTAVGLANLFFTSNFTKWSRDFLELTNVDENMLSQIWGIAELNRFKHMLEGVDTPIASIVTHGDRPIPTPNQLWMCNIFEEYELLKERLDLNGGHAISLLLHHKRMEEFIIDFVRKHVMK